MKKRIKKRGIGDWKGGNAERGLFLNWEEPKKAGEQLNQKTGGFPRKLCSIASWPATLVAQLRMIMDRILIGDWPLLAAACGSGYEISKDFQDR